MPKTETAPNEGKKEAEKMVQIPEAQLKEILNRLDILTNASDLKRLQLAMGQGEQKPIVRRVNLNVYRDLEQGKEFVILGWQMVIDEVFVTTQGVPYEKQVVRLFLEDSEGNRSEKGKDVDYLDFVRRTKKVPAEITATITDEGGKVFFQVKRVPDGRQYKVEKTFIN